MIINLLRGTFTKKIHRQLSNCQQIPSTNANSAATTLTIRYVSQPRIFANRSA